MSFHSLVSGSLKILVLLVFLTAAGTLFCYAWVSVSAEPFTYSSLDSVPVTRAGLLLGTARYLPGGRLNPYFDYRIRAAVELYRAGKISYIIASGDNSDRRYNEPKRMREELMKAGVPASGIYLDYAGFRTLDSVIRSEKIFGQNSYIIISQKFHNERAVYISRAFGQETYAYNAQDLRGLKGMRIHAREFLARVAAVIDVAVLKRQPKFLGEKVPLGE